MNARHTLLLLGSLMLTRPVLAEISYDYAELQFGVTTVDVAAPLDGDGFGPLAHVSYQFYGPFYAFGGGNLVDFSKDDLELINGEFGLGLAQPLGKNASAFFRVSYLYTEINSAIRATFDQDGYGASVGYRAENHTPWEFNATIDYVNVESGVEFGAGMSLVYDATRRFGITGGFSYFDDSASGFLGARYFFSHKH
ncbi:MAG: hypothetical protein OER80_12225 [Gammaproteobacteria bacterium]|nr:hypothetical protein [Gammaproteobacteria bacterium]MDH3768095.1 hypothetical protein [Gammaproteobacteria bacterium]